MLIISLANTPNLRSYQNNGEFNIKKGNYIKSFFINNTLYLLCIFIFSLPCLIYIRIPSIKSICINDYLHQVFKTSKVWSTPLPDPIKSLFSYSLSLQNINTIAEEIIFYLPVCIYLLTFIYLIFLLIKKIFGIKEKILTITLIFGILTYGLVIWRAGFDNLLRCIMPAYILGVYWLYMLYKHLVKSASMTKFKTILYTLIIAALPLLYVVKILYFNGFYAGSIGAIIDNQTSLKDISRAKYLKVDADRAFWIRGIVTHINQQTNKDDYVFVIPFNPIWNFLIDRPNPSYFEWLLPGIRKPEEVYAKVIHELEIKDTKYIIYIDLAIDEKVERRFANYAKPVETYIWMNYYLEKMVGPFAY